MRLFTWLLLVILALVSCTDGDSGDTTAVEQPESETAALDIDFPSDGPLGRILGLIDEGEVGQIWDELC